MIGLEDVLGPQLTPLEANLCLVLAIVGFAAIFAVCLRTMRGAR